MKRLLLASSLVLLGACATQEDTIVGKPPDDGAAGGAAGRRLASDLPKPPTRPKYPPPVVSLATWPYAEQNNTFVLTWAGGNRPALLHESPDPNSRILADVVWENGERILWQATVVSSYQPRIARAKQQWFAEGPIHSEGYLTEQQYVQMDVKKGQRVEIWAYGGDGVCYMAHKKDIFSGPCPPRETFSGLGVGKVPAEWYAPERKMWWVQISANNMSGWFVVDDRIGVDIVDP